MFPILCPEVWTDDVLERTLAQSQRVLEEHGARFVLTGGTGGQRQEPTGTNYGGTAPSWTRRTLEAVIAEHLAECPKVGYVDWHTGFGDRSEEHTSELQSLMRISYAVFCLKKNNNKKTTY